MSNEDCSPLQPDILDFERLVRDGWYGLEAPIVPAETFSITRAESCEGAHAFLRRHGCQIQQVGQTDRIIYPAGNTRQLLYPTTHAERYRVYLPDGVELREVHERFGLNNLLLPREALEREMAELSSHNQETP
jgi:hypothetical protein